MSVDSAILLVDTSALAANIEEGTHGLCTQVEKRPLTLLMLLIVGTLTIFAGAGPMAAATHELFQPASPSPRELEELRPVMSQTGTTSPTLGGLALQVKQQVEQRAPVKVEAKQPLPAQTAASQPERAGSQDQQTASPEIVAGGAAAFTMCGDGKCEPPESVESCFADCPGAVTDPTCGAELHMDPQGFAVVDGRGHHVPTVGACCAACAAHAAKSKSKPCNSWVFCYAEKQPPSRLRPIRPPACPASARSSAGWPPASASLDQWADMFWLADHTPALLFTQVFCYMPHCWSADNGNTHLFGECWLKWQADPQHPLYGQRGKYTDEFRRRNRDKHLNGLYPPPSDKHSVEATSHIDNTMDGSSVSPPPRPPVSPLARPTTR